MAEFSFSDSDSDGSEEPPLVESSAVPPLSAPAMKNMAAGEGGRKGRCPVTIVTGYLGSGKTTLINQILTCRSHGMKICVIENELGLNAPESGGHGSGRAGQLSKELGVGIEDLLVRENADDEALGSYLKLPNGCICCTVKSDLVRSVETLLSSNASITRVIIECSGVANVGAVSNLFWGDVEGDFKVRLDGVVAVVDSCNFLKASACESVLASQVMYSDRVLLNKVDTASEEQIQEVEALISSINPLAQMKRCIRGVFEGANKSWVNWLCDVQAYECGSGSGGSNGQDFFSKMLFCEEVKAPAPAPVVLDSSHVSNVKTVSVFLEGYLDLGKLERWVASILWDDDGGGGEDNIIDENNISKAYGAGSMRMYRIKGVLAAAGESSYDEDGSPPISTLPTAYRSPHRYIIQGVNDTFEIRRGGDNLTWKEGDVKRNDIVFIGANLDSDRLDKGVRASLIQQSAGK